VSGRLAVSSTARPARARELGWVRIEKAKSALAFRGVLRRVFPILVVALHPVRPVSIRLSR